MRVVSLFAGIGGFDEAFRRQGHEIVYVLPRTGNPKQGGTGHLQKDDGTIYCLDTGNTNAIEKGTEIRRLTPIECERLQGFPDGWTEGVSDSQRYKCLGNAVTVNVVEEIVKRFKSLVTPSLAQSDRANT